MDSSRSVEQAFVQSADPNRAVYNGRELVRSDRFPLHGRCSLKIVFERVNSDWPQSVRISSSMPLQINGEVGTNFVLWADTTPPEVIVTCREEMDDLLVYNAWDPSGTGKPFTGLAHGAMIVEETVAGRRYRCNDGYPDDDFDDLVFRVERLPSE